MAGQEGPAAGGRAPLPSWVLGAVVGVAAALTVGLVLALGGGDGASAAATSSPGARPGDTGGPSPLETLLPTLVAPSGSAPPGATAGPIATTAAPTQAPARTPRPTATPNTNPAIVSFKVPDTEDCTGATAGTIHVSWEIARATGVTISIDGPGIFDSYRGTSGSVDLPFGCSHQQLSHTYTLTTTGGSGPAASRTRTVTAKAPRIKVFDLPASAGCAAHSGSVAIDFAYEIVAATGVVLERDGSIYATYTGKTSTSGLTVVYDCTNASQTFTLTTTGGFGEEDTASLKVMDGL